MPLGPPIPNGDSEIVSHPLSFTVGTSGNALVRLLPNVDSKRSLPSFTKGMISDVLLAIRMCPPKIACKISAAPLKGMGLSSMPAFRLKSSIAKWGVVPVPVWPYSNLPGLALA